MIHTSCMKIEEVLQGKTSRRSMLKFINTCTRNNSCPVYYQSNYSPRVDPEYSYVPLHCTRERSQSVSQSPDPRRWLSGERPFRGASPQKLVLPLR